MLLCSYLALLGDSISSQPCPCVLCLPSSPQARILIHHFIFMTQDSFFLWFPDTFCVQELMERPPSPAAVAGGVSGCPTWLRTGGRCGPFPETAAAEGTFVEPGAAAGLPLLTDCPRLTWTGQFLLAACCYTRKVSGVTGSVNQGSSRQMWFCLTWLGEKY